jgi:hypothetical protein
VHTPERPVSWDWLELEPTHKKTVSPTFWCLQLQQLVCECEAAEVHKCVTGTASLQSDQMGPHTVACKNKCCNTATQCCCFSGPPLRWLTTCNSAALPTQRPCSTCNSWQHPVVLPGKKQHEQTTCKPWKAALALGREMSRQPNQHPHQPLVHTALTCRSGQYWLRHTSYDTRRKQSSGPCNLVARTTLFIVVSTDVGRL